MSEVLSDYINERTRIHKALTSELWDAYGTTVATRWSGAADWSGPIDDREQVANAAPEDVDAIVDAHNESPKAWSALSAILEMCDPKHDIGSFDPEAEAQDGFARNVRELIAKELGF